MACLSLPLLAPRPVMTGAIVTVITTAAATHRIQCHWRVSRQDTGVGGVWISWVDTSLITSQLLFVTYLVISRTIELSQ